MKVNASKETNEVPPLLGSNTLRNRKKRNRKKLKKLLSGNCNLDVLSILTKTSNSVKNSKKSQQLDSAFPVTKYKSEISPQLPRKDGLNLNSLPTNDEEPKKVPEKRTIEASVPESCSKKQKVIQNDGHPPKTLASKTLTNGVSCDKRICKPTLTMEERQKIKNHRRNLPVFKARNEIIKIIQQEPSTIFIGDTACGKSTQIPQYILEGGLLQSKLVAVTQPRRVAAITIAERVSKEVGTMLGERVGYCVRFEDVTSSITRIKYLTDGMLLRESITDPLLLSYSVVVLDEAHERSLHTDILFGVVKKAQKVREAQDKDKLKIVIMSATMNYNHFSEFFDDAPVYHLRGREYSITILNTLKTQEDYVYTALVTVFKIHKENSKGDILVFCTGSEEIHSMVAAISKSALELAKLGYPMLLPYALYAALPSKQQKEAFKPAPKGVRKVIFSTNIAETSVTIPGVKYVVDTGVVKARTYSSTSGFDVLKVEKISKAQAEQRAGRAGREFDGQCYRLYTVDEYKNFKNFSIPEIQRCSLAEAILQIIALGVHNIKEFDFLDRPSEKNINSAIEQLILLGAITDDSTGDLCQLTETGKTMVNFPLDPRFSKVIISSKKLRCTDEILSIISLMAVESLFITPPNERETFIKAQKKFASSHGDHIMLLNVYKAYKSSKNKIEWCHQNFVNFKSMKNAVATRKQLNQLCQRADIPPCSCRADSSLIRKCLTAGMFMNSAQLHGKKDYRTFANDQKVHLHPSSCLFIYEPSYCIYTELVETSKCYMRSISRVDSEWLKEAAPNYFKKKRFLENQMQIMPS